MFNQWIKFWDVVLQSPQEFEWNTPSSIVLDFPNLALRDFGGDGDVCLFLPPQAGHNSKLEDWDKGQSPIQVALDAGFHVFMADWKPPDSDTKDFTLDDLIDYTEIVLDTLYSVYGKVILKGDCQGGWLAAILTARNPHKVKHLIISATPIDFHADDGLIKFYSQLFPMEFYEWLVCLGGGYYNGYFQLLAFHMLNPYKYFVQEYFDLWNNIDNDQFIDRWKHFHKGWFECPRDISGPLYLDIVKMFKYNPLVKGELIINGDVVDLSKINCPVDVLTGGKDHITTEHQSTNLENFIPINHIHINESGHIGVFQGAANLKTIWPKVYQGIR